MRACYIILILLFVLPSVLALNGTLTVFTFRDVTNNELIDNAAVYITIGDKTDSFFIPKEGVLRLVELDTSSDIIVRADDYSTPGNDYYQVFKAGTLEPGVVNAYLIPVSSLGGIVKDSLENVVPHAKLKFDCSRKLDFPSETDEFGSFFVDYIPTGQCMVYAGYEDSTGTTEIDMEKGNLSQIEIMLDKSLIIPKKSSNMDILFIILGIIVLIAAVYALSRLKKPEKQAKGDSSTLDKTSNKLMETLNDKEKSVVQYLIANDNTAQQSSVRHSLHMPRTSLSRVIDSLQKKKILNVEKQGKSVKIALTDFFLDKD